MAKKKHRFIDDDGHKVKAVTAEQHALDNPGHKVIVEARPTDSQGFRILWLGCSSCTWWNEEGYK